MPTKTKASPNGATPIAMPTEQLAVRVEARLVGVAPLLMHAPTLLDPFDPMAREYRVLTGKRNKTADDHERIARVEWEAGLYHDGDRPVYPARNIKRCLREAGTNWRLGEAVKRAVRVEQALIPLEYDGPQDIEGLWDAGFRDVSAIANSGMNRGRVARCRPCFDEWALDFGMLVDTRELDLDHLGMIFQRCAALLGLGDYRPEYGLFEVARLEEVERGYAR